MQNPQPALTASCHFGPLLPPPLTPHLAKAGDSDGGEEKEAPNVTEAPRVQVLPADILSHLPWPESWVQVAGLCDGKTNQPWRKPGVAHPAPGPGRPTWRQSGELRQLCGAPCPWFFLIFCYLFIKFPLTLNLPSTS